LKYIFSWFSSGRQVNLNSFFTIYNSTLIFESGYLQLKAARTKSVERRGQGAKLDEKGMKRSFLHDHPYNQLQDLINEVCWVHVQKADENWVENYPCISLYHASSKWENPHPIPCFTFESERASSFLSLDSNKRLNKRKSAPGLILNLREYGYLLKMNLIGWSVDCLCRSVAEISCNDGQELKIHVKKRKFVWTIKERNKSYLNDWEFFSSII